MLTGNSFLADKVALRLSMIPVKKNLNVLDAFAGKGSIWKNVQKKYCGKINITKIDKYQKDDGFMLLGDNRKYLSSLPLELYDVIDLDSYGTPYDQLKIIFERNYKGIVFLTFISIVVLNYQFLIDMGITKKMINKCPTIFCKNKLETIAHWLSMKGVKSIQVRQKNKKVYIGFTIP